MAEVTVAIPSFRRPQGLERLLRALEELNTCASVSVLVADNDAERRDASAVCASAWSRGYRWPLECIVAEERGIAQARNVLVESILSKPGSDFIAMLDDDEWPEPDWLDQFLQVQEATGADALHGAVLRDFETVPEKWVRNCHGIAPMRDRTGHIAMIDSTSNVLVSRACLEGLRKPCFDPNFALSGGEDRDFFERLRRQGKSFAWADDAIVHAWVPASRASVRWVLQRAYRTGNSDMRVLLKHAGWLPQMIAEAAKIAAIASLYPILLIALLPFAPRRAELLCKILRAAGKAAALLGHRYDEYAVVHGA